MTGAVRHFLDHNAGAPLLPAARARMIEVLDLAGNPSSVHAEGRAARAVVEQARAEIAALCGTRPDRVLFTSGGSESNAWMLHQARGHQARGHQARGHQAAVGRLAVSAVEHDSVLAAAPDAPRIPVDDQGVVHPHAVAAVLDRLPDGGAGALVAVMAVNNETGVIQPVAEIAALVHARGGRVACDAVQAAGRLDLGTLCGAVDFLSLSAHKIGGPKGVGVLVVGPEIEPAALIPGGQEYRRRGGTENLAGIAGFGAAAAVLGATDRAAEAQRLAALRDRIQAALADAAPDVLFPGRDAAFGRVPNTLSVVLPGIAAETQVMRMDLAGIAVSAGSACSSGKVAASPVLAAMGLGDLAGQALRVSLGAGSTADDAEAFIAAWCRMAARRNRAAAE
ncbi:cysteine desulfurase family protein [uncultured Tistrella sp.]|uniref:cysteine desulfurase family protein n=1 Tax=Tistrella mobilis TaxID=171437 RepID=UPI000C0A0135|nr:cysteine desulfurase family protein [uncultured Tistrella sp.]MAM73806.1 aminotransferase [Tistrella sp.]